MEDARMHWQRLRLKQWECYMVGTQSICKWEGVGFLLILALSGMTACFCCPPYQFLRCGGIIFTPHTLEPLKGPDLDTCRAIKLA
eukprot:296720-Pelagomonas_calceolata.AAC.1